MVQTTAENKKTLLFVCNLSWLFLVFLRPNKMESGIEPVSPEVLIASFCVGEREPWWRESLLC